MTSAQSHLSPFALAPRLVPRIWGTRDLRRWYPDSTAGEPIGEAWLSGDDCLALSGELRGQTLCQIAASHASALLGPDSASTDSPLLIKILFAQEKLSVQVHPDDAMAERLGSPRGKTECWYALEADPGAEVACGLKPGATREAIEASLRGPTPDHNLEQWLNPIPVHPGDLIFVDAGTVHAIWPGSILLETQQNSDITYRLYDYGRPRPLHIEESLAAMRLRTEAGKVRPIALADRTQLVDCAYFRMEKIPVCGDVSSEMLHANEPSGKLSFLFLQSGNARASSLAETSIPWPANTLLVVPARSEGFQLHCDSPAELIRIVAK